MAAFLVTGNPGSGKSKVARELTDRGFRAIDPDYDPALSAWKTASGELLTLRDGPTAPDQEWLQSHRWVWTRSRMAELVDDPGPVFVCGIALNIPEVRDLFDRLVLLHIDEATQEDRLAAHDVMYPPGRTEAGHQQIRVGREVFEAQMADLGATAIDATRPPAAIVDDLLSLVATR